MKEGQKSFAQLHANRKRFVEQAMQEGMLEGMSRKKVDIGLMYTFNDELTLDDIATQVYPQDKSGRANVSLQFRGKRRGFIVTLFAKVSSALSSQYKIEDLLEKKPISQSSRERISEDRGGRTLKIRDLIFSGAKSVDELEEQSDLSREGIWLALGILERWGIDVSQFSSAIKKNKEKIRELMEEKDDKKIQKIMDGLSDIVILYNINNKKGIKKKRNPRVFTTIGKITPKVYHYRSTETHLFTQGLNENGIPNRKIEHVIKGVRRSYYVLLEKHRDRALAAWEKDPRLERFKVPNPVTIVCGNKNTDIPTGNHLYSSGNFRSVSSVLSDLGMEIRSKRHTDFKKRFFEDCPITVFEYMGGRYIPAADIDQFKQYFFQKRAQSTAFFC